MTEGKTKEIILPAWPACSHRVWVNLQCDTLWKPCTCADSSLFPATCSPCCCFAWEQHSQWKHFQTQKLRVPCGRRVLCWGRPVLIPSMAVARERSQVCVPRQVSAWAHLEILSWGCAPGYFLFVSWSTTSCLFGQIGLKIIRHWGWACGLQQAVQALGDSLGLALCVQQEMTMYFNGFFQLFAVLFWKCAVP